MPGSAPSPESRSSPSWGLDEHTPPLVASIGDGARDQRCHGSNFIQEIHTSYNTAPNSDRVTGLGLPNAAALFPPLISLTS